MRRFKMEEKEPENTVPTNEHVHRLFANEKPSKQFRLYISEFDAIEHELDELSNQLSQATENDELIIDISSPGGYVVDLMRIENICREYFYGRVTTKANHYGYSCGAIAFLFGDERVAFENSELMFHDISTGIFGKRSDINNEIVHNKKYWDEYLERTLSPFFSKKEIDSLFRGKEIWMGCLEMCERGIATQVNCFGNVVPAEWYIKYRKDAKTRKQIISQLYEARENLSRKDEDFLVYEYNKLKGKK